MVNIDNVYQKVLALANKEQRGYITPQEFNLMANKAQREIFDSYFHDVKTAYHKKKNQMGVAFDDIEMIQEKLQPLHVNVSWQQDINDFTIDLTNIVTDNNVNVSEDLYMIDTLEKIHVAPTGFTSENNDDTNVAPLGLGDNLHLTEVTEMSNKEIVYSEHHPLTAATQLRPVYVRTTNSQLRVYPSPAVATTFILKYWKTPTPPSWAYVVVNNKALYNANLSVNFELHASEEERLVNQILKLSGVIIEDPGVMQAAMVDIQNTHQSQNN